ncbi:MAG: NAD(P)-dependent oxidoreductase [Alphaproteobacteria bacterium]|mgnify:CR=1 FL=1|nr:NAD(P)-dependent oxidoreductase [Alphaproteobacteria bacterium]
MPPQSILVTGSSGLIGFPLACGLVGGGHRVVGLDPAPPPGPNPGFEAIESTAESVEDWRRLIDVHGIDRIAHTGGISGPMLALDKPYAITRTNLIATTDLVEAAWRADIARLVYCSSASAYGDTPPAPVPDDAPLRPTNLYGATKAAGDLIVDGYRGQYGLHAVGLRFSTVYGPGRRTSCDIREIVTKSLAGEPVRFQWGKGAPRQFVFVNDAVMAIRRALDVEPPPQYAYNIAGPDFVDLAVVAEIVKQHVPDADIEIGDGPDGTGYRRDRMDISAAERDLGYSPEFGIERGVGAYLTWVRESGTLPYVA